MIELEHQICFDYGRQCMSTLYAVARDFHLDSHSPSRGFLEALRGFRVAASLEIVVDKCVSIDLKGKISQDLKEKSIIRRFRDSTVQQ